MCQNDTEIITTHRPPYETSVLDEELLERKTVGKCMQGRALSAFLLQCDKCGVGAGQLPAHRIRVFCQGVKGVNLVFFLDWES